MTGLVLSAGAVLAFSGLLWRSWDRREVAPMWLLGGALAFIVIGVLLS